MNYATRLGVLARTSIWVLMFAPSSVCLAQAEAPRIGLPGTDSMMGPAAGKKAVATEAFAHGYPADNFAGAVTTDHFVIAFQEDRHWAEAVGRMLERFHVEFTESFTEAGFSLTEQRERLVWVCFEAEDDYHRYSRRVDRFDVSWISAYYSSRSHVVAMLRHMGSEATASPQYESAEDKTGLRAGAGEIALAATDGALGADPARIRHEAAHQLAYDLGLQKRGVMYPFWVSEGLATDFEVAADEQNAAPPATRRRRHDLVTAYREGGLEPIERFVLRTAIGADERTDAALLYAQAWGFWTFMSRQRPQELRAYFDALSSLPMGARDRHRLRVEVSDAFGPLEKLNISWHRYLESLASAEESAPASPE